MNELVTFLLGAVATAWTYNVALVRRVDRVWLEVCRVQDHLKLKPLGYKGE